MRFGAWTSILGNHTRRVPRSIASVNRNVRRPSIVFCARAKTSVPVGGSCAGSSKETVRGARAHGQRAWASRRGPGPRSGSSRSAGLGLDRLAVDPHLERVGRDRRLRAKRRNLDRPAAFAASPTSRFPVCFASASAEGSCDSGREKDSAGRWSGGAPESGSLPSPLARIAADERGRGEDTRRPRAPSRWCELTLVACRKALVRRSRQATDVDRDLRAGRRARAAGGLLFHTMPFSAASTVGWSTLRTVKPAWMSARLASASAWPTTSGTASLPARTGPQRDVDPDLRPRPDLGSGRRQLRDDCALRPFEAHRERIDPEPDLL